MGAEFLSRTRKTIIKHIDSKRVALATPDILMRSPADQPRCVIASVAAGATLNDGDLLIVESRNGSLNARRGNSIVAEFDRPAGEIIAAIDKSGGVANGVVTRVHKLSKKVEVSLC
jgi:hypothetical protein